MLSLSLSFPLSPSTVKVEGGWVMLSFSLSLSPSTVKVRVAG